MLTLQKSPPGRLSGRSFLPNSTSVAKLAYVVWYGCSVTWSMVGSTSASPATSTTTRRPASFGRPSHHAMPYAASTASAGIAKSSWRSPW